jgi:MoaA/NifB/PqqE/SkfB family radical SAM enzyme
MVKTMVLDYDYVEVVELDLTTMCNASCPLCFRNHKDFPKKFQKPFARNTIDILN